MSVVDLDEAVALAIVALAWIVYSAFALYTAHAVWVGR